MKFVRPSSAPHSQVCFLFLFTVPLGGEGQYYPSKGHDKTNYRSREGGTSGESGDPQGQRE